MKQQRLIVDDQVLVEIEVLPRSDRNRRVDPVDARTDFLNVRSRRRIGNHERLLALAVIGWRGCVTTRPVVTLPSAHRSFYALRVSPENSPTSEEGLWARRIMAATPARDVPAETALYRALATRVRLYGL